MDMYIVCYFFLALLASAGAYRRSIRSVTRSSSLKEKSFGNDGARVPQTLTFREASTGVKVTLVGSMHYNPSSILLAEETVRTLKPSSVLVESCEKRWERTMKKQARGTLMRNILDNEMQAATEAVEDLVPGGTIILADQPIDETNARMKDTLVNSLKDIAFFRWKNIIDDVMEGYNQAVATEGEGYLGLSDFFDPKLLAGTPGSLIRYPLAIILKSPVVGIVLVGLFASSMAGAGDNSFYFDTPLGRAVELGESVILSMVEFAILGRTFLVALLAERNVILADNIREECQRIKREGKSGDDDGGGAVAVLGMAHCNGVRKLLV